jgi:3-hydroxyacyl-CoA dehydrogenase / 3-hydroxy-2-methylbutyryl-CoA dehydrogenase
MLIREGVFLVTGAASGLGRAAAAELLQRGARVAALDLNTPLAFAGAESHSLVLQADVTDEESVRAAVSRTVEHFGALHGCINCAGIITPSPVLTGTEPSSAAIFRRVVEVNLTGTYIVICHTAAAILRTQLGDREKERGVIVNIASIRAFESGANGAAYGSSKSGVAGMTLGLARELSVHQIRVACIAPGLMDTPMFNGLPTDATAAFLQGVPYPKRTGHPSEFADLTCHVIENEYLNGTTIRLDGGLRV